MSDYRDSRDDYADYVICVICAHLTERAMGHGVVSCLKKIFGLDEDRESAASHELSDTRQVPPVTKKLDGTTIVLQPAHTVRLKPEPETEVPREAARHAAAAGTTETILSWCGLTDTGMVRDHNEDYFLCAAFEDSILFVVADGMGGHDAGEVASRLATEAVCREVQKGKNRKRDPLGLIEHAVKQANADVIREGKNKGSNMGTTIGVAYVAGNAAYIAGVGDSRVYWIENGSIRQITQDHSLVAKLVSVGKLTKEEARNHPKSNLLYRTVGTDENINIDTFKVELKKNESLLLCTDGLWGEVTDEDIHKVCIAEKDIKAACARLVQMANANGGKDNITAVVVRVV